MNFARRCASRHGPGGTLDMTLIGSLRQALDRVLLRVVDTPGARVVHEFTGKQLLDSEKIARLQPICRRFPNCFAAFAAQPGIVSPPDWSYALRQGSSRSSVANDPCRWLEVSTQFTAPIESAAGRSFDYIARFSEESAARRWLSGFRMPTREQRSLRSHVHGTLHRRSSTPAPHR